tara:strand:+ start:517 stop:702 length:186 start_codon:yes stop_codon:yes gene_type:complete
MYRIKIDMEKEALLEILTYYVCNNIGVNLGQVYEPNEHKIALDQAEILEEVGFKTKLIINR